MIAVSREPHLGDIAGDMPLPMRPVYMPRASARCWSCRKTHRLLAGIGISVVAGLILIHLVMTFAWSWP